MPKKLWIDCETYSELDLKTVGTYRYADSCEVMLITWAMDDGPVQCWDVTNVSGAGHGDKHLRRLDQDIADADEIWAHNSMFDRNCMAPMFRSIPVTHWRDTMVQALSHSLPGGLDQLCSIFQIGEDQAKNKDGRKLIQLFCKPRPKNHKLRRATRLTHPEEWQRFIDYAKSDIEAMRALHYKMPKWNYPNNPTELAHWHLDQKINDRGFMIDPKMAESVIVAIKKEQARLKKVTKEKTNNEVGSMNQRDALLEHILKDYGIVLDNLTKGGVNKALDSDEIPDGVKELLRLRLQVSSNSTAKYKVFLNCKNDDDRMRGTIQFCGAQRTGRGAGRKIQPHNLPSRGLLPDKLVDEGIKLMGIGAEDLVFPDVMKLAVSSIRKTIVSAPGKKFCISDLSNIEGRKVAWLANEEWKLEAFRAFDLGLGPDLYIMAYAKAFNVPIEEVTRKQRDNIGKTLELSCAFGGGVGAFAAMAGNFSVDLEKLSADIQDTLPKNIVAEAANFLEWTKKQKRSRYGLSDNAFITVDVLKRLWREAHPNVVQLWSNLQAAADLAIITKKPQQVGLVTFDMKGAWLRIKLPSRRYLCYPDARSGADGVSYTGVNQYTRKWERIRTYGSKFLENIAQASARDILYAAMPEAEKHDYEIVLHVHDELVTETPDDRNYSAKDLSDILAENPLWAKGLPLAAAGFESYRYKK